MSNNPKSGAGGLRVKHNLEDFDETHETILTLEDKPILSSGQLNDDEDALEEVVLAEQEKRSLAYKESKRKGYDAYADQQFDADGSVKLLTKYDELQVEKAGFKVDLDKNAVVAHEDAKPKVAQRTGVSYSIDSLKRPSIRSDYLTPDEVQFKSKSVGTGGTKKKRRNAGDIFEGEGEDDVDASKRNADLGSRRDYEIKANAAAAASAQDKRDAYRRALATAQAQSRLKYGGGAGVADDAEELTRLRQLQGPAVNRKRDVSLADIMKKRREDEKAAAGTTKRDDMYDDGDVVEYGDTHEFVRIVQPVKAAVEQDDDDEMKVEDKATGGAKVETAPVPGQLQIKLKTESFEQEPQAGPAPSDDEDDDEHDDEDEILDNEPKVSRSMTDTLKLISQKGADNTQRFVGRAKDKQLKADEQLDVEAVDSREANSKEENKDKWDFSHIKLDYKDRRGRDLTQEEAYRVLSYRFHAKGPGKKKMEKRLLSLKRDMKARTSSVTDTPTGWVASMKKEQAKTQQPFVLLSGGVKNLNQ